MSLAYYEANVETTAQVGMILGAVETLAVPGSDRNTDKIMNTAFDNSNHKHDGKFFEEFIDITSPEHPKGLGVHVVDRTDRLLGVAGQFEYDLVNNIWLMRGSGKLVLVKASQAKPVRVRTIRQKH